MADKRIYQLTEGFDRFDRFIAIDRLGDGEAQKFDVSQFLTIDQGAGVFVALVGNQVVDGIKTWNNEAIFWDNVGIGVNGEYKLHVKGESGADNIVVIEDADSDSRLVFGLSANGWKIGTEFNLTGQIEPILFTTSDDPQLFIDTNGRIGINTLIPSSLLHLDVPALGDGIGFEYSIGVSGSKFLQAFNNNGTLDTLHFSSLSAANLLVLQHDGLIGIGTDLPTELLTIDAGGGSGGIYIDTAATGLGYILFGALNGFGKGDSGLYYNDNSGNFYIETAATPRFDINTAGQVTVSDLAGVDSRSVVADAAGLLSTQALLVQHWEVATGGINYAGGRVGIGQPVPAGILHLKYGSASTDPLFFENTDQTGGVIWRIGPGVGGVDRFAFYNGTDFVLTLFDDTTVALVSLAGTGTRMVVADPSGLLSTQTIPAGAGVWQPAPSGIYYDAGNVMIGSNGDPLAKLDVVAGSSGVGSELGHFRLIDATDTTKKLYMGFDSLTGTDGSFYMQAIYSGTGYLTTILHPEGGTVMVGKGGPSGGAFMVSRTLTVGEQIAVHSAGGASGYTWFMNTSQLWWMEVQNPASGSYGVNCMVLRDTDDDFMVWDRLGQYVFVPKDTMNFGLGIHNPNERLVIMSTSDDVVVDLNCGPGHYSAMLFGSTLGSGKGAGKISYDDTINDMTFFTSFVERMVLKADGKIGLRTTAVEYDVDIEGYTRIKRTLTTPPAPGDFSGNLDLFLSHTGSDVETGPAMYFSLQDSTGIQYGMGYIAGSRDGADNSGKLEFGTYSTGIRTTQMGLDKGGNLSLGLKKAVLPTNVDRTFNIYHSDTPAVSLTNSTTQWDMRLFADNLEFYNAGKRRVDFDGTVFHVRTSLEAVNFTIGDNYMKYLNLTSGVGVDVFYDLSTGDFWYDASDKKLKKNIKTLKADSLAFVRKLEVKTFDRKDGSIKHEVGVIAQEVQKLDSTLVTADREGTLAIRNQQLRWHWHKAIQQLAKKIEAIEAKL